MTLKLCRPRVLTDAQLRLYTQRSIEVNPANARQARSVERSLPGTKGGRRLALLVGNRWPVTGVKLGVKFLDDPSVELRKKILSHMNAWSKTANIQFRESKNSAEVRIARLDKPTDMAGYWSYVGTEILGIEDDQPTMNLDSFTMRTSDAEFRRVVRHEAGHTLGFEHEHMRTDLIDFIDKKEAIAYFKKTEGWSEQETKEQVLTPLSKRSLMATTESDPLSIMCYHIAAEITKNGKPIPGGTDITEKDYEFAGRVYPKNRSVGRRAFNPAEISEDTIEQGLVVPAASVARIAKPTSARDPLEIVILEPFDSKTGVNRSAKKQEDQTSDDDRPVFAQVFASYGGARVTGTMRLRSDASQTTHYGNIIRIHERIKQFTNQSTGSLPKDPEMLKFGGELFETLFQGDVRRLYDEARSRNPNRKLDIILTSMIPWIAEKPWEFAYDTTRQSFLATEEVHFIRNVLTAIPAETVPTYRSPLRILVVASQPVGLMELSVNQEIEVIRRGFRELEEKQLVEVEVLARATPNAIQRALSTGQFTIVHFIGHGMFSEENETGTLELEDEMKNRVPLNSRSVREIFCRRGVSLVFLNSCQSGSGGRREFNRGVAQSLVSHGVPAVVANQYSVLDSSATSFSKHFYWALAQGMSVGEAASEARIAVNCSMDGDPIDWAVPVVYARDAGMRICERTDTTVVSSESLFKSRSRKAEKEIQVAVWDIDNVFPGLERTLDTMSGAQEVFDFQVVSISAPIDAWDKQNRATDGTSYLWADKLAKRLSRWVSELQVDVLVCVTRHWLRSDDWFNLYGWWPANKKPPVLIFSCAGFEDLPVEGPETDKALANLAVTGLAGMFADLDSHERGPKDCPLYFNEERDLGLLTAHQKFDARCLASIKKVIPNYVDAFEALLATFE